MRMKRGVVYTWIVVALKDGEERLAPMAPARAEFRVIGMRESGRLRDATRLSKSDAARGVLYAREGMLDNAERAFEKHLRSVPHDRRARELLAKVRSWRQG